MFFICDTVYILELPIDEAVSRFIAQHKHKVKR
jgi:hypothetical protein